MPGWVTKREWDEFKFQLSRASFGEVRGLANNFLQQALNIYQPPEEIGLAWNKLALAMGEVSARSEYRENLTFVILKNGPVNPLILKAPLLGGFCCRHAA